MCAQVPNAYIHRAGTAEEQLSRAQYKEVTTSLLSARVTRRVPQILHDSVFCPAPTGYQSPETFRLYEALDSGCIPLVDGGQAYFENLFSGLPAIERCVCAAAAAIMD